MARRVHTGAIRAEAHLIGSWAYRDFQAQYRQSSLQLGWSVIQPMSLVLVYAFVFSEILSVSSGDVPYLSAVVAGIVPWRMLTVGFNQSRAFLDQSHLMSRVYFRREIIPLSATVVGLTDLAIGTVILISAAWIQGVPPYWTLLLLPIVYVPIVLYSAAIGVLVATVTVFVRDMGLALPTVMQLIALSAPVFYLIDQFPKSMKWLRLNPLAILIEAVRDVSLRHTVPSWVGIVVNIGIGCALLVGAIIYLRSIEHRIVDIA